MRKQFHHKIMKILERFTTSTHGSFTTAIAVSMPVIFLAVGTTYDISRLHQANQLAQITADNMALFASTSVDRKNGDHFKNNTSYPYAKISADGSDFTKSIIGRVQYDIAATEIDGDRIIARATVGGEYIPIFLGLISKSQTIPFSVTADVIFSQDEQTPASVFFVTDISGSMDWTDAAGYKKITSLKSSLKEFMQELKGADTVENDILRSGLFAYHSVAVPSRSTFPKWGTLTNKDINKLQAGGGTNSTPALTLARSAFLYEDAIHTQKNGIENPLKYLIFMSDGLNGGPMQTDCSESQVWVPEERFYWHRRRNGRYVKRYTKPRRPWRWSFVNSVPGSWKTVRTCGQPYNVADHTSLQICESLRNENVKVYSIAYNITGNNAFRAKEFMKNCSFSPDEYYMDANSGTDLSEVFKEIGRRISKEVVRLKS